MKFNSILFILNKKWPKTQLALNYAKSFPLKKNEILNPIFDI